MCLSKRTQKLKTPGYDDEEDAVGFAKTFPDIPFELLMSGGLSLRLSNPQDHEKLEKTPVDWATWESPLQTDTASLKNCRVRHTIDFILKFLKVCREFKDSISGWNISLCKSGRVCELLNPPG